jgi:hypothetical protein
LLVIVLGVGLWGGPSSPSTSSPPPDTHDVSPCAKLDEFLVAPRVSGPFALAIPQYGSRGPISAVEGSWGDLQITALPDNQVAITATSDAGLAWVDGEILDWGVELACGDGTWREIEVRHATDDCGNSYVHHSLRAGESMVVDGVGLTLPGQDTQLIRYKLVSDDTVYSNPVNVTLPRR